MTRYRIDYTFRDAGGSGCGSSDVSLAVPMAWEHASAVAQMIAAHHGVPGRAVTVTGWEQA